MNYASTSSDKTIIRVQGLKDICERINKSLISIYMDIDDKTRIDLIIRDGATFNSSHLKEFIDYIMENKDTEIYIGTTHNEKNINSAFLVSRPNVERSIFSMVKEKGQNKINYKVSIGTPSVMIIDSSDFIDE